MSNPNPQSAPPYEGDFEDFQAKRDWFQTFRPETPGRNLADAIWNAMDHARQLDLQDDLLEDPGGGQPAGGFEIFNPHNEVFTLSETPNPADRCSRGFASPCYKIESNDEHLEDVILKFSLSNDALSYIEPSTIKVFRYNPDMQSWTLVKKSGVHVSGHYGWVRVFSPGTFVAIGLPRNPRAFAEFLSLWKEKTLLRNLLNDGQAAVDNAITRTLDHLDMEIQANLNADPVTRSMMSAPASPSTGWTHTYLPDVLPVPGYPEFELLDLYISHPGEGSGHIHTPRPDYPWKNTQMKTALAAQWSSMGPTNYNGRIKSILSHPTDSNIIWLGGANGGVWKTTDGGASWASTFFEQDTMAIGSLAVCESQPLVLYAGTGEATPGWGPSYPGTGVFKSIDGGDNWTKCALVAAISDFRTTKIVVAVNDANLVYVATNNGVYKSGNGGASWGQVKTGYITDLMMDPTDNNVLYCGVWCDGVYKSTDAGVSWTPLRGNPAVLPTGSSAEWIKLAMARSGPSGTQFIMAKMGMNSGYLYKSFDGGATWARVPGAYGAFYMNEWSNLFGINPKDENNIFAGAYFMQYTTDGTNYYYSGGTKPDQQAVAFDPNDPNVIWLCGDSGVYKSTNKGQMFTWMGNGVTATQLYSLGVSQTGNFLLGAATQDQGIIKTTGALNWADTAAGNEGGIFVVDPNDSANVYCSPFSTGLRRSIDSASTWTTITNGFTDTVNGVQTSAAVIYSLAVMPGNSNVLLATGTITATINGAIYQAHYIYRSIDKGTTWTKAATLDARPTRVVFAPGNGQIAYAATIQGSFFASINAGQAWTQKVTFQAVVISGIAVSHLNANTVTITYGGLSNVRVVRTTNGGGKWTDITGKNAATKFPIVPTSSIVADQFSDTIYYVGTDIGVFRTTDTGTNWANFNIGIPRVHITEVLLQKKNNTLYASTMGRGAYQRTL